MAKMRDEATQPALVASGLFEVTSTQTYVAISDRRAVDLPERQLV